MIGTITTFIISYLAKGYIWFRDKFMWIFFGGGSGGSRLLDHVTDNTLTNILTFAVLVLSLIAGVQKVAILYKDYKLKLLEIEQKKTEILQAKKEAENTETLDNSLQDTKEKIIPIKGN